MEARPPGTAPGVFILVAQARQLCLHWPGADGMLAPLDGFRLKVDTDSALPETGLPDGAQSSVEARAD